MPKYAEKTKVPISKSKQQIEKLLIDWGVKEYFFGSSPRGDGIGFKYKDKAYKISVPIKADHSERQKCQMWRILYMSLKMKLEEIDAGLIGFEDQFLSMMALPDGTTVADFMRLPENLQLLQEAKMPKMLTG